MRAQPYLWPSFIENIGKLPQGIQVKIAGIQVGGK